MPATPRPDPEGEEKPPRRLSLPRKRILRGRRHFDAAFEKGRRFSNRCLTLLVLPAERAEDLALPPGEELRPSGEVAFLTPKRLGEAALRNRVRRRLREGYRLHFAPETGRRLIWLAKGPATALDFGGIVSQMKELHARSLAPR